MPMVTIHCSRDVNNPDDSTFFRSGAASALKVLADAMPANAREFAVKFLDAMTVVLQANSIPLSEKFELLRDRCD